MTTPGNPPTGTSAPDQTDSTTAVIAPLLLSAVATGPLTLDVIHHTDLLSLCGALPDQSVDMILADLPYGTTACDWDEVIPFEPMWKAFKRVVKRRGAIVLTASQPFTSRLVMSNLEMFREEIIWDKNSVTGFLDVNRKHMKRHENLLVFSVDTPNYFPQKSGVATKRFGKTPDVNRKSELWRDFSDVAERGIGYPQSIVAYMRPNNLTGGGYHPTQKPVALFEYLIRTYARPGEVVVDPCCGSGTTALAARNTGRHYICSDTLEKYVKVAKDRLSKPYTPPLLTADVPAPLPSQLALAGVLP